MSQGTPADAPAGIQDPEPGFTTTEFYVTLLTLVMPAVTLIWHQDFTPQIQALAVAAAGVASAIYTVMRTMRKSGVDKGRASAAAASPQPSTSAPSVVTQAEAARLAAGNELWSALQLFEKVNKSEPLNGAARPVGVGGIGVPA